MAAIYVVQCAVVAGVILLLGVLTLRRNKRRLREKVLIARKDAMLKPARNASPDDGR